MRTNRVVYACDICGTTATTSQHSDLPFNWWVVDAPNKQMRHICHPCANELKRSLAYTSQLLGSSLVVEIEEPERVKEHSYTTTPGRLTIRVVGEES